MIIQLKGMSSVVGDIENGTCGQTTENMEIIQDQSAAETNIQLVGRPTSNILEFEHIENEIYTCAPGENSVPRYVLMDDEFEVLAFPDMFLDGDDGYSMRRVSKD